MFQTLILAAMIGLTQTPVPAGTGSAGSTDDCLQYDDGEPWWISWGGVYRGTWFDTGDFFTEPCELMLGAAEYWFMHSSSFPWDNDQFVAAVYNGDVSGPVELLYDTTVVASHMTGVMVEFADSIQTGPDFWLIVGTELSAGGWPSSVADAENCGHSFRSDDFMVYDEAIGDWFIRAHGSPYDLSLLCDTWGGIKALY